MKCIERRGGPLGSCFQVDCLVDSTVIVNVSNLFTVILST